MKKKAKLNLVTGDENLVTSKETYVAFDSEGNIAAFKQRNDAGELVTILKTPSKENPLETPLTFEVTSDGNIVWEVYSEPFLTVEYKKNNGNWTEITASKEGTIIPVVAGDVVQFRGDNPTYTPGGNEAHTFSNTTCGFKLSGNIMSLIDSENFSTATVLEYAVPGHPDIDSNFQFMFSWCTGLTDASNLMLPATSLTDACYKGMFKGCTNLLVAPELPATTLASNCYQEMFGDCTNLTTAPVLPANTLETECYYSMFDKCTSLNYIKCLATTFGTRSTTYWIRRVGATGTFVKSANAEWPSSPWDYNGIPTNWTVENI